LQFIVPHRGLYTGAALDYSGERLLDGLDVSPAALEGVAPAAWHWGAARLAAQLPRRRPDTHKGRSGHVLCIGGDHGSGGAVMLAAEAALRSGAGLASVATRGAHVAPLLARCPEAMPHVVDDVQGVLPLVA